MSVFIGSIFVILLILSAIAGLLSASETAVTASSKARLHVLSKGGDRRAQLAQQLQENLGLSLSTILLCNMLCLAFINGIATDIVTDHFGKDALIFMPILISLFLVVYAETLPKIIAASDPEKILLFVIRPIWIVYRFFKPITLAINYIARAHLRFFNYKSEIQNEFAALEELRGTIDLHFSSKKESMDERAMLRSILELRSVDVDEIMVHRKNVTMIDADDPVPAIVEQVLSSPFTRIPLWRGNIDNIIGVIHAKDLLRLIQSQGGELNDLDISSILSEPWFIIETRDLIGQLRAFRARREHMAIVIDEYGAFKGIVTLEDILEEIVGDISDEHDVAVRGIRSQEDGAYVIDGTVTIRDVNRELDWDLPDEGAATMAGLLIYKIRKIPEVGQVFNIHGYRFEVLRRHRNQITLLKLYSKEMAGK